MIVYELHVDPRDLIVATYRQGGQQHEVLAVFVRYVAVPTPTGGRGIAVELVWDAFAAAPTAPYYAPQQRLSSLTIGAADLLDLRPYAAS